MYHTGLLLQGFGKDILAEKHCIKEGKISLCKALYRLFSSIIFHPKFYHIFP